MSRLWRLLAIAQPERARLAGATLLQVLTIGAGIGLTGTSAWLLSCAAQHPSIAALQVAIVGVRAFGIGRATLRYGERLVSHDATLRLLARLRLAVFRALVPLAPARLTEHRAGDVLGRVIEDVATLEGFYVRVLGPSLAVLPVAAIVTGLLWPRGAALAGVALAGLAVSGVLAPALAARLARRPGRAAIACRGALAAALVDGVRGSAELLAFGGERTHADAVANLSRAALAAQARAARAAALGGACAGLAADLSVVAVLVFAIPAVRAGRLDGVLLAVVALVTLASFEVTAALPLAWQALGSTREAASRLFALLDAAPAVAEPPSVGEASSGGAASRPLLEIRTLRFAYPGASRLALDGVSLRLEPGWRVAVVGPSGSGKSTLAQILLRFQESPPGTVWLEGRDVRELPSDAVRQRIAYAAQRADVLAGTLRENLTLGRPGLGDDRLLAALRGVGLEPLATRAPAGLDAWLGEQGQLLSGGERQRIGLARALLASGPLLLLDEPTAHLDALTERAVLAQIIRAGEGRATILITHRLVGLDAFDEVLVLGQGRVLERGRATALEAQGGVFTRLLRLQRDVGALDDAAFADQAEWPARTASIAGRPST